MIRSRKQGPAGRAIAASTALVRGGFWIVSLLVITSSAGALALPADPIAAQSGPAAVANRMQGTVESSANAPSAARVSRTEFGLNRTGDTPVNLGTRFTNGPRVVYGFVDYSEVNVGDRLRWVLRFREGPIDVNYGDIVATGSTGRTVLELKRLDNEPLMPGTFDLIVGILPEAGGLELRRGSFEISDGNGSSRRSSSGDNGSSEDNSSEDNGSSSRSSGDNSSEDNGDSEDNGSEDNGDSEDEDNK